MKAEEVDNQIIAPTAEDEKMRNVTTPMKSSQSVVAPVAPLNSYTHHYKRPNTVHHLTLYMYMLRTLVSHWNEEISCFEAK